MTYIMHERSLVQFYFAVISKLPKQITGHYMHARARARAQRDTHILAFLSCTRTMNAN